MCPTLECISSWASILGFILTLITLIVANKVKDKVVQLHESEKFHICRSEIIAKLDGYIGSIEKDCLYESDSRKTLKSSILLHLKDIETKYTHLSCKTNRSIMKTRKNLEAHPISWHAVAESLIALKNNIEKEI